MDVFEKYDEGLVEESKSLKVSQVKTLFNDLSYVSGVVYCFLKEFKDTNQYAGVKQSSQKFIREFKRYLWRDIHDLNLN